MVTDANEQAATNFRPYAPPSNLISILQRLRSRNLPDRIDADYLRDSGIPEGTVNRTLSAARFVGLITEGGIPMQPLRAIHTSTDEEYRSIVAGLVREAYTDVFAVLDPAEDGQDRIANFFRRYTPASQRARMVMFFLGLCREAGIATLDTPRQRTMGAAKPSRPVSPRTVSGTATPKRSKPSGQIGRTYGGGGAGAALTALIDSLPPPGSPLSEARRSQWLRMAEATLGFVYPETETIADGGDDQDLTPVESI